MQCDPAAGVQNIEPLQNDFHHSIFCVIIPFHRFRPSRSLLYQYIIIENDIAFIFHFSLFIFHFSLFIFHFNSRLHRKYRGHQWVIFFVHSTEWIDVVTTPLLFIDQ